MSEYGTSVRYLARIKPWGFGSADHEPASLDMSDADPALIDALRDARQSGWAADRRYYRHLATTYNRAKDLPVVLGADDLRRIDLDWYAADDSASPWQRRANARRVIHMLIVKAKKLKQQPSEFRIGLRALKRCIAGEWIKYRIATRELPRTQRGAA